MLDPKIFDDPSVVLASLIDRGMLAAGSMVDEIVDLIALKKSLTTSIQNHNAKIKQLSRRIHAGEDLKEQVKQIKLELVEYEAEEAIVSAKYREKMLMVPNIPGDKVPIGSDETHNVLNHLGSCVAPSITKAKDHVELGLNMGCMDFERTAKMSGTRFVTLSGALAKLERALGAFMLDFHVARGWLEVSPPLLANQAAMEGTGQLPKFKDDAYDTGYGYLIPTAEVTLTNQYRDSIIEIDHPTRMVALTACFRKEAGSAGKDTKGIIRQHQFYKVELVSICDETNAYLEYSFMLDAVTLILEALKLPFRRMRLCTGDLGFSARSTNDYEVWIPSQNTYREISSVSWCGDFQGRRMNTRYRDEDGKLKFVHTMNGSGLAVGRTLVAVMENYQREDGGITIPDVLRPYMRTTFIPTCISPTGELL